MSAGKLDFDKQAFLARYWQRQPLLIRGAISGFTSPLPADELAGLALEADIESRLIEHRDDQWRVQHGPFEAVDFQRDHPWTLLVQAVDHYVPAVASLRQSIDFLPQWRVDDVMVSYAVDGGSVGPHYDNYDVFLLQGEGRRRWRLGQACDADSAILPHDELRILRDFDCSDEYLLGPGDILYVPPGIAHWGIAEGECTTFSIGFRAPRINELVSRWADRLLEQIDPEQFYRDPDSEPPCSAGEIRSTDIARVQTQLLAALERAKNNHWFGELVTEPRYDCSVERAELARGRRLLAGAARRITLSAAARVAWQQEAGGIVVFANGEAGTFPEAVRKSLITLCEHWLLEGEALQGALAEPQVVNLLTHLLSAGCIDVE